MATLKLSQAHYAGVTNMMTQFKYPRLITLLRHQCSLSITEAIACLDKRDSEASLHYGGYKKCIKDAIEAKSRLYKQFNNSPLEFWFTRRDRNLLREIGF